ncbi:MAG: hypothetical protein KDH88_01085 [Chromatiales bacterium]|nr:hypothetical protein [Chromatiales bacterium]
MSENRQTAIDDDLFESAAGKLKRIVIDLRRSQDNYHIYCECKPDSEPSEAEVALLNRHWRGIGAEVEKSDPGITLCDFVQVLVSRLGVQWLDVTVSVDLPEGYQSMLEFCTAYRNGDLGTAVNAR